MSKSRLALQTLFPSFTVSTLTAYKFLTKEERISVVGAMLNDIDEIITEEVQ